MSVNLGTFIFEISNILLLMSWLGLAFMVWRVRKTNFLNGGECPIVMTLLSFAVTRMMQSVGYHPWEMPVVMAVVSALTITSTLILMNVLNTLKNRKPTSSFEVPDAAVKLYAALKKNGSGEH